MDVPVRGSRSRDVEGMRRCFANRTGNGRLRRLRTSEPRVEEGTLEVFRVPLVHDKQRPSRRGSPTNRTPTPLPQMTPDIFAQGLHLHQRRGRMASHRIPLMLLLLVKGKQKPSLSFFLAPSTFIDGTKVWICPWIDTTTPLRPSTPSVLRGVRVPTSKAHGEMRRRGNNSRPSDINLGELLSRTGLKVVQVSAPPRIRLEGRC